MNPITREAVIERRQPHMRWSAVLAGTALSIGLWILLQVLGMGLGLSAVDTDDAGSLRSVSIGTGIWSLIAPLIALFVGAMLTGRLAGTRDRKVGAMHGSVTWALATAIGLWAIVTLVSTMVNGVTRAGTAAVQASSAVVSGAARAGASVDAGNVMSSLGIDTDDLVAPINERLQREGKPQITPAQLEATMKSVARRGVRNGQLDRTVLVEELARNTSLSRADAEDIANDVEARYNDVSTRVQTRASELGERATKVGLEAADKAGKTLLAGGLMMLLSLGAAIAGGALGARGRSRDRDLDRDITARELRERDLREREVMQREVTGVDPSLPPRSGAV
jgi:hypothetical protein